MVHLTDTQTYFPHLEGDRRKLVFQILPLHPTPPPDPRSPSSCTGDFRPSSEVAWGTWGSSVEAWPASLCRELTWGTLMGTAVRVPSTCVETDRSWVDQLDHAVSTPHPTVKTICSGKLGQLWQTPATVNTSRSSLIPFSFFPQFLLDLLLIKIYQYSDVFIIPLNSIYFYMAAFTTLWCFT